MAVVDHLTVYNLVSTGKYDMVEAMCLLQHRLSCKRDDKDWSEYIAFVDERIDWLFIPLVWRSFETSTQHTLSRPSRQTGDMLEMAI